jgi:hypothetical protein
MWLSSNTMAVAIDRFLSTFVMTIPSTADRVAKPPQKAVVVGGRCGGGRVDFRDDVPSFRPWPSSPSLELLTNPSVTVCLSVSGKKSSVVVAVVPRGESSGMRRWSSFVGLLDRPPLHQCNSFHTTAVVERPIRRLRRSSIVQRPRPENPSPSEPQRRPPPQSNAL